MLPATERKEPELGRLAAVWNAFRNKDISHYPRFLDAEGKEQQISDDEIIGRIARELSNLKGYQNSEIEFALKRGRESLDEVKGLTEYEDQKATRNLTVITFLSALAGVLFSRFSDAYPLRTSIENFNIMTPEAILVAAGYFLFFCSVMCAVMGALVVFHATRIRFKYPKLTTLTLNESTERAKSYLFYSPIIQILPERWAQSFLQDAAVPTDGKKLLDEALGLSYLRNYIIESYLVATKVADKLRYLMPAQDILSWSIRLLFVWLFVFAVAVAFVPNQSKSKGDVHDSAAATIRGLNQTDGLILDPAKEDPTRSAEKR